MTRHTLFSMALLALLAGFPAQTYHPVSLRNGLDGVRSINTLLTLDPLQLPKGLERRSPLTPPPPLANPMHA